MTFLFNDRKTIVFASEGWNFPEELSHELVPLTWSFQVLTFSR